MSVSDAGEARLIVLRGAVVWEEAEFTGKHKDGTGRLRKARGLTGKGRTAVATGGAEGMEKRWMIHLQTGWLGVL